MFRECSSFSINRLWPIKWNNAILIVLGKFSKDVIVKYRSIHDGGQEKENIEGDFQIVETRE